MAVNVPMASSTDGPFPLPYQGEVFLLTRDRIQLSFKDASRQVKPVKGRLFMTNVRMVFRVSPHDVDKAGCESFEMPFRGLWEERLNQPIFSANNLTATLQYYDDQPFQGALSLKLLFVEGGVNTFLQMFNSVLRVTRHQLEMERRAGQNPPAIPISSSTPSPQEYMPGHTEAFIDPNDPSRIYTTQPVTEDASRRDQAPSWSVSGSGLRKR